MELEGDTSPITAPGQFVNVKLDKFYLRRPISVCNVEGDILTLVYKTVGEGTCVMSSLEAGTQLDILTGLGNGYDTSKSGDRPLLVGGGVGTPPLYMLCRRLIEEGKKPRVALGFNTASEIFLAEDFAALGVEVGVATVDGSFGVKGFVTQLCTEPDYTYIYACGPMPMLRALNQAALTEGQFSLNLETVGYMFTRLSR